MSPSVEILRFAANDAYIANPAILGEAMELISQAPGAIQIHSGPDAQEPEHIWIVIVWESLEHRRAFEANKEVFSKIDEAIQKASTKVEFVHDVTFSADIFDALAAPATELLSWDLHATTDIAHFLKLQASLVDRILELSPPVLHKGGWGVTASNERKTFICLGWDSPAAFKAFITGTPELLAIIGQMRELANVNIQLATLVKYERK